MHDRSAGRHGLDDRLRCVGHLGPVVHKNDLAFARRRADAARLKRRNRLGDQVLQVFVDEGRRRDQIVDAMLERLSSDASGVEQHGGDGARRRAPAAQIGRRAGKVNEGTQQSLLGWRLF